MHWGTCKEGPTQNTTDTAKKGGELLPVVRRVAPIRFRDHFIRVSQLHGTPHTVCASALLWAAYADRVGATRAIRAIRAIRRCSLTPPGSPQPAQQPSSTMPYDHAARVAAAMVSSGAGKQDLDAMTNFFIEQLHLKNPVKVELTMFPM